MCGRYNLYNKPKKQWFDENEKYLTSYNIAPNKFATVITETKVRPMRWGMFGVVDGRTTINARSDKIEWWLNKNMERIAIPTTGYYEWNKREDGRIPFHNHLNGKTFYMAGLAMDHCFVILTTDSNNILSDREPVLLSESGVYRWFIHQVIPERMDDELQIVPISTEINDPTNNHPELIEPIF